MMIGTNISAEQERLLSQARERPGRIELFLRVARDSDIRGGREDLHQDWLKLFEAQRETIERERPGVIRELTSFFDEARPIDSTLASIVPATQKTTFLLGAGASKPEPSRIPTVKELLPQLLERARRLDRDDVTRLADYCDVEKIDNIEDLLTAAQLATFCSRTPTVLQLMNHLLYRRDAEEPSPVSYREGYGRIRMGRPEVAADVPSVAFLQDTLQVLFGLLASTMLPARANDCHKAIVEYMSNYKGAAIVTTNYDCLIDMALEEGKAALDYRIAFDNVPEAQSNGGAREILIKLHGSLNWYYCETCREVQRVDITQMIEQYMKDTSPYPVIGICKQCGGQRRGLLAPISQINLSGNIDKRRKSAANIRV